MNTLTITFAPATVSVSDDRGSVDGARFVVSDANGVRIAGGEAIAPEGDAPECWLGLIADVLPVEVIRAIADSMTRGDLAPVSVDVEIG